VDSSKIKSSNSINGSSKIGSSNNNSLPGGG
jgi:hypothetical protein